MGSSYIISKEHSSVSKIYDVYGYFKCKVKERMKGYINQPAQE